MDNPNAVLSTNHLNMLSQHGPDPFPIRPHLAQILLSWKVLSILLHGRLKAVKLENVFFTNFHITWCIQ